MESPGARPGPADGGSSKSESAEAWLCRISQRDWDDHVRFKAEVALVLAANGNPRAAARLHCEAGIDTTTSPRTGTRSGSPSPCSPSLVAVT